MQVAFRLQDCKVVAEVEPDTVRGFAEQITSWIGNLKRSSAEDHLLVLLVATRQESFPLRGTEAGRLKSLLQSAIAGLSHSVLSELANRQPSEVAATVCIGMKLPMGELLKSASMLADQIRSAIFLNAYERELCYHLLLTSIHGANAIRSRGVMPESEKSQAVREFRDSIAKLMAMRDTDDFKSQMQAATDLRHSFQLQLATAIAPSVNKFIASHPQKTFEQKQSLAADINDALRELGLAIKCPNTGSPCILSLDNRASEGNLSSRYCFRSRQADGKRKRTASMVELGTVELVEDLPRREGLVEWQKRVSAENDDKPKRTR